MSDVLQGALRSPVNLLTEQKYAGHKSLHDDAEAARLGIKAGPIEGPTHFSQFVPLLAGVWGNDWYERGCFSAHFLNMVFDGEKVRAEIDRPAPGATRTLARAFKEDGTPVLEASASIGPDHRETLLEGRMKALRPAGDLVILADLKVGMTGRDNEIVRMGPDQHMGDLYPFSLADKLKVITETDPMYADAKASPWGKAVIPLEMISVLGNYSSHGARFPVKNPSIGLFADLEIRMIDGPLFVGEDYLVRREIVALSESRRVENYWVRTRFYDAKGGKQLAEMLLNHGVMKASYPHYPKERLA
ncbi:MAG: hypothetical protein FP825_02580 [Hyphomonas sp.]|uniref:hypothetical protein n=1 Tax=Hyphomonas sp. TaxID=87 RepID=UPI00179F3906|nr:hypothetical protein [Hyphomonas sp.]MBA3067350.1 hypothetical protein [Hyphomonas sp.]MBU3920126.1 hypothetical protein [Alphaproteobacteria bacterium]MBU4063039.1 hypothetical protein [Alphaproteobacteria bacterium]MBU4163620.1 hypothetical protein [Alphaproteobacteria bacterium]